MGLRTIPIVVKLWHRGPRTAMKKTALCQSANHLHLPADRASSSSEEYIFVLSVFILMVLNVAQGLQ